MSANHRAPDHDWRTRGRCAQPAADLRIWFPTTKGRSQAIRDEAAEPAKAECLKCDVLDRCRRTILALPENLQASGVIAAMTPRERRAERDRIKDATPTLSVRQQRITALLKSGHRNIDIAQIMGLDREVTDRAIARLRKAGVAA